MITGLARVTLALLVTLLATGCVGSPTPERDPRVSPAPAIRFGVDTFAFPNESRSKNREKPDLYANWCFVMARAVTQFHQFARFDPSAPRLSSGEYT